jgi:hypothetical protein
MLNDELKGIYKEGVVAYFKVLARLSSEGNEKTMRNHRQYMSWPRFELGTSEYNADITT